MTKWTVPEIDWLSFGETVARPKMPHLAEATVIAKGAARRPRRSRSARPAPEADAVAEAWEALTTRFDCVDMVDDPRRVFLPYAGILPRRSGLQSSSDHAPPNASSAPLSVEMAVALAALGRNTVINAESLMLEAGRRLRPWHATAPTRVAWVLVDKDWTAPSGAPEWRRDPLHAPVVVAMVPMNSPHGSVEEDRVDRARQEYAAQMRALFERLRAAGRWPDLSRVVQTVRGPFMDLHAPPSSIDAFVQQAAPNRTSPNRAQREPHLAFLRRAGDFAEAWWHWRWLVADGAAAQNEHGPYYDYYFPQGVNRRLMRDLPDPLDPILELYGLGLLPIDLRGDVAIVGVFNGFPPVTARTWASLKKRQYAAYGEVR